MRIYVAGTRGIPEVLGGVEKHCEHLYPLMVKDDLNITVIARSPYVKYISSQYKRVKLRSIWAPKKKSIEAIIHTFLAALYSKKNGADVMHIHAVGPGLLVPFCKLIGLKVVFTHHGPDYDRQKWGVFAKFILKLGERLAVKYADEVIVISNVINELIKHKYGRKDAHLIYNGVEPFSANKLDPLPYFSRHKLEPRQYIVAVGRFVEEKGFHDLINAYEKTSQKIKLVIIGDADHPTKYSEELKSAVKDNENIHLTGFIKGDELSSIFSHAATFVMPSYHEGLPIALLEAMSYSLPVIISDIPANKEVGLDKDSYFKTGSVNDLAQLLEYSFLKEFSAINYSKYLENYQWNDIAIKTENVYERLLPSR